MWKVLKVLFLQNCKAKRGRQSAWIALHLQCSWVSQSARQPYLDQRGSGFARDLCKQNFSSNRHCRNSLWFYWVPHWAVTERALVRDSLRIAIGKYAEATAGKISSSQLLARQICSAEILQGVPNQKSLYCQEPQEPQDRHFVALFDKTEVCSVVLSMLQVFLVQISPAHLCHLARFCVFGIIGNRWFPYWKSCAFRSKSSHYYYLKIIVCSHWNWGTIKNCQLTTWNENDSAWNGNAARIWALTINGKHAISLQLHNPHDNTRVESSLQSLVQGLPQSWFTARPRIEGKRALNIEWIVVTVVNSFSKAHSHSDIK